MRFSFVFLILRSKILVLLSTKKNPALYRKQVGHLTGNRTRVNETGCCWQKKFLPTAIPMQKANLTLQETTDRIHLSKKKHYPQPHPYRKQTWEHYRQPHSPQLLFLDRIRYCSGIDILILTYARISLVV